ncbi:MAG: hypothetical protein AB7N24_00980 [Dehalococcoidia bacterium]
MAFEYGLRTYQAEVLLALLGNIADFPGETFTVMFPRQAGKNEVSAALVSALLLDNAARGGSIIVCAPTLHPQATISFQRTADRLRTIDRRLRIGFATEGNTIRVGDASATFLSGSPEANVAGHTASLLLIGDEAQDLDEDWFNRQFRPMAASTGAPTVLFGTPWQGDSLIEHAIAKNVARDLDAAPGLPGWHQQVDWQRVARYLPAYGTFVEQERARLGATHPIFLSQYELTTVEAEGRLLRPGALWALEGAFGPLGSPVAGERYVGGLDFAGEGADGDATAMAIARLVDGGAEVVFAAGWHGAPFHEVTSEIVAMARKWRLERLVCDATGMGAPLTANLVRELGRIVQPFVFTASSKSSLGFDLIAAAANGALHIAPPMTRPLQALWDELRACRAQPFAGGQLAWSAPPAHHDDFVAALALCLRAAQGVGPPRVAVGRR